MTPYCPFCTAVPNEVGLRLQLCTKHRVSVDPINHPAHYKAGGIESIDVIEAFALGFNLGNVVKYILRHKSKGAPLQDLKKARWYLDREITNLEKKG